GDVVGDGLQCDVLQVQGVNRTGRGFTGELHRDLHHDLLTTAHQDEVDVLQGAVHRVHLDGLGQRQFVLALDLQRQQGVDVVLQRQERLVAGQAEVHRVRAVSVQHGRDVAGTAGAAGCALAELGTPGCGEHVVGISHGVLSSVSESVSGPAGQGWTAAQGDLGTMYFRRVDHGADRVAHHRSPRQLHQCSGSPPAATTRFGCWWPAGVSDRPQQRCPRPILPQALPAKSLVTGPSSNTSRIARPISGAMESTVSPSNRFSSGTGTVLVITTSVAPHSLSRWGAGSESTPWVAATKTLRAPSALSTLTASVMVPPVSIRSSTRMQSRPATSPTTRLATAWLGRVTSRVLCTNARGTPPSLAAQCSATRIRPASGETTAARSASIRVRT